MKPFVAIQSYLDAKPSGWVANRLRRVSELIETVNSDGTAQLLSLTIAGRLDPRGADVQPPSPEYLLKYGLVEKDDLVVNPMWLAGGAIGVSSTRGAVSPEYRIYRFGSDVVPRFIHHLVRSDPYMHQYRLLVRAETTFDRRVTKDDFRELPLLLPPLATQRAIGDFLDTETAQIDALVEKKRRMVELLEERFTASINLLFHPIHFRETVALKYVANIVSGQSPPESTYNDIGDGLPLVNGPAEFTEGDYGKTHATRWTTEPKAVVPDGTLLFCLRGGTTGRMNRAGGVVAAGRGVAAIEGNALDDEALFFIVLCLRDDVLGSANGSTFPSVTSEQLGRLEVPILPTEEMEHRKNVANEANSKRTRLVGILEQQIDLLVERRQALITAAVTGELTIPGVAA